MKRRFSSWVLVVAIAAASSALAQKTTLARLNHDVTPDISRPPSVTRTNPITPPARRNVALRDSTLSRLAADALFAHSNLTRARSLAARAWQRDHRDAEALFVQMEADGMQADDTAMLDAAVRLCELGRASEGDPRVQLAAVRVREMAANTADFRSVLPRVQSLLANSAESWPTLNAALLSAAMDGVAGLDPYVLSRAAGILTDWRIVGPLGRHPLLDFDQPAIAPGDELAQASYQNHAVENFQFPDGWISLPEYMPHRGTYYAAAHFASLTAGGWAVNSEGAGALEVFVDGQSVLRQLSTAAHGQTSASFEVPAGPHRVLLRFAGPATPLRIWILPATNYAAAPARANLSSQELAYQLAAEAYAAGEFGTTIQQINAVSSARESAALQFLLAQAWSKPSGAKGDGTPAWTKLRGLAPTALAADVALGKNALAAGNVTEAAKLARHVLVSRPADVAALEILAAAQSGDENDGLDAEDASDVWTRRMAMHPSCEGLQAAIAFYRVQSQMAEAAAAQQRLDGCAPESVVYAQSLAEQGSHALAAQALQRLLLAAPLNRSAWQLRVRELQMAGDDAAAQRAAADWLRIAPNAENYHRLAAKGEGASAGITPPEARSNAVEFYQAYRRDALQAARQSAGGKFSGPAVVLFDDHVAISRTDGSVSLYIHTATRVFNQQGILQDGAMKIPQGAQILGLRAIHADGTVESADSQTAFAALDLAPDDVVEQEYVLHYAGDGGIAEHSEAFQFVFGNFDQPVLSARFVTLTSAQHADRGVVITTGDAPPMVAHIRDGMLARVWQEDAAAAGSDVGPTFNKGLAIVRVVEQENGWTVPSNAEHQRRIETIHPGPRLEDSRLRLPRCKAGPFRG